MLEKPIQRYVGLRERDEPDAPFVLAFTTLLARSAETPAGPRILRLILARSAESTGVVEVFCVCEQNAGGKRVFVQQR